MPYEQIVETVGDGIYQLDADGRFVAVNDTVAEATGYDREQLLGEHVSMLLPAADIAYAETTLRAIVAARDRSVHTLDLTVVTADGDEMLCELRFRALFSDDRFEGTVGVVRDVTERAASEWALAESERQFRTLVEGVAEYAIFLLDAEGRVATWNEGARRIKGYRADEILGEPYERFYTPDAVARGEPARTLARAAETGSVEVEGWRVRNDGSRFWARATVTAVRGDDGEIEGYAKVTRDMTDQKERENALLREREFTEQMLDTSPVGIVVFDTDGHRLRMNRRAQELLAIPDDRRDDYSPADRAVHDESGGEVPPDEHPFAVALRTEQPVYDRRLEVTLPDGSVRWLSVSAEPFYDDGELAGVITTGEDITELKERERQLRQERDVTEQIIETTPVSVGVVDAEGISVLVNTLGEQTLGVPREEIIGRPFDMTGWEVFDDDGERIPREEYPLVRALEDGVSTYDWECMLDPASGETVWLSFNVSPLEDDGEVEGAVVVTSDVTDRKEHERRLERQRDELDALNRVNEVIRRIDRAIVRAETRGEIEQAVCDGLAASEPYRFAVLGEFDQSLSRFEPHAWSGISEEYLDAILDLTPEQIRNGPGARASETGEVVVVQDVQREAHDYWRETTRKFGYRSIASVPIQRDGTVFAVLGVYADRPNAFDERERAVLAELGEVVGYAISAVKTRQGLIAEQVVELEFRVRDPDHFYSVLSATDEGCRVEFEGAVFQSDESLLYYTSVVGLDPERVLAVAERDPGVGHARIVREDPDGTGCLLESSYEVGVLFQTVADHGGVVRSAVAENGESRLCIDLPVAGDVRALVEAFERAFATVELVSRQMVERPIEPKQTFRTTLDERLTDRQLVALQAAYRAGFFEWPRASTGEEVADSMGVSAPTFHRHLRLAERKLLAELFENSTAA